MSLPDPARAPARLLSDLLRDPPPPSRALAVAAALAHAVEAAHRRREMVGPLDPGAVRVEPDGAVTLGEPARGPADPLDPARAGALPFTAPEVLRGGRPRRAADAFAVAAAAHALLSGTGPFDAGEPLETVRRVLFERPRRLRGLPREWAGPLEAALASGLARSPWRRRGAGALARDLDRALAVATAPAQGTPGPSPGRRDLAFSSIGPDGSARVSGGPGDSARVPGVPDDSARVPGGPDDSARVPGVPDDSARVSDGPDDSALSPTGGEGGTVQAARHEGEGAAARAARLLVRLRPPALRLPRLATRVSRRAALTALAAAALALATVLLPRGEGALQSRFAEHLARGELLEARAVLDASGRAAGDPVLEKLRGDLACAGGATGECLRRYRVALAGRPDLSRDPAIRANAVRLLGRGHACAVRRAAARLLGELRAPEALPALEEARRSAGLFGFLCTGDALDRAIRATRAEQRAER